MKNTMLLTVMVLAALSLSACSVVMGPKRYSQNYVGPSGYSGPGYYGNPYYGENSVGHTSAQWRESVTSYDHRTNQQMNANNGPR